VRDYTPKRTPENMQFFRLTDATPLEAFRRKVTEEQFWRLKKKIVTPQIIGKIMYYKKLYNRVHPAQVAPEMHNILYEARTIGQYCNLG